jgi:hypothetical protein
MPIDNPEFQLPFKLVSDGALEIEQGAAEEIQQCIYGICCFRIGERLDMPTFGIPDELFQKGGVDLDALENAVLEWEDRAEALFEQDPNWIRTLVSQITIGRDTHG